MGIWHPLFRGGGCAGGLFRRGDFKERAKGVVTVVVVRVCASASVELVRLYVLLYAASAIALASRINYTTRRMFLFPLSLPKRKEGVRKGLL